MENKVFSRHELRVILLLLAYPNKYKSINQLCKDIPPDDKKEIYPVFNKFIGFDLIIQEKGFFKLNYDKLFTQYPEIKQELQEHIDKTPIAEDVKNNFNLIVKNFDNKKRCNNPEFWNNFGNKIKKNIKPQSTKLKDSEKEILQTLIYITKKEVK